MKKIAAGILATVIVVSAGSIGVFAGPMHGNHHGTGAYHHYYVQGMCGMNSGIHCGNYIDADGNGICDNYGTNNYCVNGNGNCFFRGGSNR